MSSLREVVLAYWAARPMEQAAALSYYTLLSLAPLVLLAVSVAGLVFERGAVEHRIIAEMGVLIGAEGADAVELVLRNAERMEQHGNDDTRAVLASGAMDHQRRGIVQQLREQLAKAVCVEPDVTTIGLAHDLERIRRR